MANKTTAPTETEAHQQAAIRRRAERRQHTDKSGISEVWGEILPQADIDIGV